MAYSKNTTNVGSGVTFVGMTGVVAGAERVRLTFDGVQLNTTSNGSGNDLLLQFGNSPQGFKATGYEGRVKDVDTGGQRRHSNGWPVVTGAGSSASDINSAKIYGSIEAICTDPADEKWTLVGFNLTGYSATASFQMIGGGGALDLPGEMDRWRFIFENGTDTFTGGKITYEYWS